MISAYSAVRYVPDIRLRSTVTRFYFCFIDYAKAFDWVDHNKLWKILNSDPDFSEAR